MLSFFFAKNKNVISDALNYSDINSNNSLILQSRVVQINFNILN